MIQYHVENDLPAFANFILQMDLPDALTFGTKPK